MKQTININIKDKTGCLIIESKKWVLYKKYEVFIKTLHTFYTV